MLTKKKKVILDTNFLLIPGQFKVDIFSEVERIIDEPYKLCIMKDSIKELNKIVTLGNQKDRAAAKLAIALVGSLSKQKSLKTIGGSSRKDVDGQIVDKSNKKVYIATQDKELKKRVKDQGAKVITLKQKKYLVVE